MFRINEGQDYLVYRIFVFGGIGVLMGTPILAVLILGDQISQGSFGTLYLAALTLWIAGILAYWWWAFLFKGEGGAAAENPDGVPPIKALRSLRDLHGAMAIQGGDPAAARAAARAALRPVLEFFGWQNLLVLWLFGFIWGFYLEILPNRLSYMLPAGLVVIAVLTLVRTFWLVRGSGEGYAEAYLAPLGLAFSELPTVRINPLTVLTGGQFALPEGAAVLQGTRRGRPVRIEILDQNSVTQIQAPAPDFTLISEAGKLMVAGEASESIRKAIQSLRKARRWRDIQVLGTQDGITIHRATRKQNMWLYDLWLAEYLLDRLE